MTSVGKTYEGKKLVIQACDPLADEYNKIIRRYSLEPPVVTEKCDGERLSEVYPRDYYDWVNAQNCVDHSYDPVLVLQEIISVTKSGGYISLNHEVNAARNEACRGLHQWNFSKKNGDFVISGKRGYKKNITQEFRDQVELTIWIDNNNWICVIGKKKGG